VGLSGLNLRVLVPYTRWERTPWRATQRAAWEALGRTWTAVSRGTESG
jgi:hypothetical protein